MISIANKVVDNVTHLPEFILGVTRGTLQVMGTGKNMVVEPMLDTLRTPEEYQQAIEQRIATWNNIIQSLESITPEQATELQHTLIADIVTLHVLAKCTKQVKQSFTESTPTPQETTPMPKQTAAQLEQQSVQAAKPKASTTPEGLQVSKLKAQSAAPKEKVYEPAKEELGKTGRLKAEAEELEKSLGEYEKCRIKQQIPELEKLIEDATFVRITSKNTRIYELNGGYERAKIDFETLQPKNVTIKTDIKGEIMLGKLENGYNVNVRCFSSGESLPTLEIQMKNKVKFRYI